MRFAVAADAYDRFMGRYSVRLAPSFADLAGDRALDVGCGPGADDRARQTSRSDSHSSGRSVEQFAAAAQGAIRVDVRVAAAEALPFTDGDFDAVLAQLVVHFMDDPVRGLAEMARHT